MQVRLAESLANNSQAQIAAKELRKCVHCGFCNVTCPTFHLESNELDSPRGRLYLMKEILETDSANQTMQKHLDRCLTCRSCETTCPANLHYSLVLDFGREMIEQKVPRSLSSSLSRWLARQVLPRRNLFGLLLGVGRLCKPLLPKRIQQLIPEKVLAGPLPEQQQQRKMLLLEGCVQEAAEPLVNAAAKRVLAKLGVGLESIPRVGCCGAVPYHLGGKEQSLQMARNNIDGWWPLIESGAEAVVATSSACGLMIKEYVDLLAQDPNYADKAARVSELCRDVLEVIEQEDIAALGIDAGKAGKIAVHTPCTLQHGQQLPGRLEALLKKTGFDLATVADPHLCCGAAGTYMMFEQDFSDRLLMKKKQALLQDFPEQVVSANIGCQMHLSGALGQRVGHWIELFDRPE